MSNNDRKTKGKRRPRTVDGAVAAKAKETLAATQTDKKAKAAQPDPGSSLISPGQKLLLPGTETHPRAVRLRRTIFIILPALSVVALVWVAGSLYGMRYYIGGAEVSSQSPPAMLERTVRQTAQSYRLRIADPEGKVTGYTFQDMGMQVDIAATLASLQNHRNSLGARLQWWRPVPMQLQLRTDTADFQRFISQHAAYTIQPATDASIKIEDGKVKIQDGKAGKQYGLTNAIATLLSAAEEMKTEPLRMRQVAVKPAITTSQLADVRESLEHILQQKITVTIADESVTPQAKDVAEWIKLIPDTAAKTIKIEHNKEAIKAYVDGIASDHYRPPKAQLSNGATTIPGVMGVRVTDTREPADAIADRLLQAQGMAVNLPVRKTPFRTVSAPLAGRWIVVDITTKRMYAYQHTSLLKTFLISAGAPATPTPVGRFAIYSKFARQNMSGPNADGSRYYQPNVPWVSYFYQDYAIHGNYWRPLSYFGNVNSSHGCVGVTSADAAWVYNWAVAGTPVIVHS